MPPEDFGAGSRFKFAFDLTSGLPPRFFGIIGLEENFDFDPRAAMRCGENLEKKRVSGFEFQVSRFSTFKDTSLRLLLNLGQFTDGAPPGPLLAAKREHALFRLSSFQRSFIALRDPGSLSAATFFRPRQSPHRTLGPWRLATLVANVLSQETSGVSVREVTGARDSK